MALYKDYEKAMNESNLEAYLALLHDDFTVTVINPETHFLKVNGRKW